MVKTLNFNRIDRFIHKIIIETSELVQERGLEY